MPHIEISLLDGTTEDQKKRLAGAVVKAAQEIIGFGDESYSVEIRDYTLNQWKSEVYPDIVDRHDVLYKKPGYEM